MKIRISASSGPHFTIPFPTAFVTSPTMVRIFLRQTQKYAGISVSDEAIRGLCRELKRVKKTCGSYELVHVESANGDLVSITL